MEVKKGRPVFILFHFACLPTLTFNWKVGLLSDLLLTFSPTLFHLQHRGYSIHLNGLCSLCLVINDFPCWNYWCLHTGCTGIAAKSQKTPVQGDFSLSTIGWAGGSTALLTALSLWIFCTGHMLISSQMEWRPKKCNLGVWHERN